MYKLYKFYLSVLCVLGVITNVATVSNFGHISNQFDIFGIYYETVHRNGLRNYIIIDKYISGAGVAQSA